MKKEITDVQIMEQRGVQIYIFHIQAAMLVPMCRVDRFTEGTGVQRQINERHVLRIAEAMADETTTWLDPMLGALVGEWTFDDGVLVRENQSAMISLDDGQHRWAALNSGLLTNDEIAELQFEFKVTRGLSRERRMHIFRAQAHRRGIDRRLDLAQRHELDEWPSRKHKVAYDVVLMLNSAAGSPLRDRVELLDRSRRSYEGKGQEAGGKIPSSGLHSSIVTLLGNKSPLHALEEADQHRVVMDMIRVASDVWPNAWNSKGHILTTARGINAVLRLCVSGTNFRSIVGVEFKADKVREALSYAQRFKWAVSSWRNRGVKDMTDSLDQSIGNAMMKAMQRRAAKANGKD